MGFNLKAQKKPFYNTQEEVIEAAYNALDNSLKPEGYAVSSSNLVLSTFAISLLSLALPIMTLQVYDRILPNPDSGTLPVLTIAVCVVIILEVFLILFPFFKVTKTAAASGGIESVSFVTSD